MMNRNYTVAQQNGRWQLLTPEGKPFFSLGVDCVTTTESDYHKNLGTAAGDWFPAWADGRLALLNELGFNTLGAWHHPYYWGNHYPKTVEVRMSASAEKVNTVWGAGFPDVFDPSFERSCHQAMINTLHSMKADLRQDAGLIGYYTDNEIHWWGSGGYWGEDDQGSTNLSADLVNDYIGKPPSSAGKQRLLAFIRERYHDDVEAMNAALGCEYSQFDDLMHIQHFRADHKAELHALKTDFLRLIAQTYFRVTDQVLKQFDPMRLNLGTRLVGSSTPDVVLEVMKEYVDVASYNFYCLDFPRPVLDHAYSILQKPIMITEFSFCAGREAGFTFISNGARNVHVKDQARRGECYRRFVTDAHQCPYVVGTHFFSLYDFGDLKGLAGNYGLLDLEGKVYSEFTQAVKETHECLGR